MDHLLTSIGNLLLPKFKLMPATQEFQMRSVNCIVFLIFSMTICGFAMGTVISCYSTESKDMSTINGMCWAKQAVEVFKTLSIMNATKVGKKEFRFTDQGLTSNNIYIQSQKQSIQVYKTCEHVFFITLAVIMSYSTSYCIASYFNREDLNDLIKGKTCHYFQYVFSSKDLLLIFSTIINGQ